jgi:DNA-directed RNA polymerase
LGQRLVFENDLATARWIVEHGNVFYVPMNLDYRGRLYGIPSFNFQRQDYVRGLFQFAAGRTCDQRALYWLKVHVANSGDFDKISKRPYDERVEWVDGSIGAILAIARNPMKQVALWSEADNPFLFVASCMALVDAMAGEPVHIPVSFDGSCSGLQHLCAMTKSTEGSLVNLVPLPEPQDVYQTVADKAQARIEADLENPEVAHFAKMALDYGVGRSLVKRNVMTYSYSSPKRGMQDQHKEDLMRPLALKVLSGEIPKHPFGEDGGYRAANYLGETIFETIEGVITKPAEAMRFLQSCARGLASENKPMVWHTPLGLPVYLCYPRAERKQAALYLHDRGVTVRVRALVQEFTDKIDGRRASNAVAPSFVHSMDACHLQDVVIHASRSNITNMALVHDSFGCLPADAEEFRRIILERFVALYSERDVLTEVREEVLSQLESNHERVLPVPTPGELDINLIMEADYAFS